MIAVALITFRETLEMLLIGSAVYSALQENNIQKKKELIMGAFAGFIVSGALFIVVLFASSLIRVDVHEWGEILEGINYVVTGLFLFLTAVLLHKKMRQIVSLSPSYLLSTSIFAIGFLTIFREGLEIVFFSLSSTMMLNFSTSLFGFAMGIGATLMLGILGTKYALSKLSHTKLLMISEWAIKLLALYFVVKGVVELGEFVL